MQYQRIRRQDDIVWLDQNNDVVAPPEAVELELNWLEENLYKKAAAYAGLKYPFDPEEENYYQKQKLDQYQAFIAGYMEGLNY